MPRDTGPVLQPEHHQKQERSMEEEEYELAEVESDDEEEFEPEALGADAAAEPAAAPEEAGDESLDEILAKRPEEQAADEEEDEESILSLDRDERLETLTVRVIPKQETEFVCQKCHLLKPIRSQLADKQRMYCRDCA
jgi:hypothetical protein